MKEITHGLQYRVYAYNKKEYLKKPTSLFFKLKVLNSWWPKMSLKEKKKFAKSSTKIMVNSINFFKKQKNFEKSLIGNPIFLPNYSYLQDITIPIQNYLKIHNNKQNYKIINRYVDLLLEMCKDGFMEKVFNFDRNCGINKNGKVILFDFTEITSNLKIALNLIKKKAWLKKEAYKNLNPSLKKYFKMIMDKKFTKEKVKKMWAKKLNTNFN